MRVTSMLPDVQYQLQQSQQGLATALQQVSTGKRVNQLSDDPAASASMVRSIAASANLDTYTSNGSAVLSGLQTADSALSVVSAALSRAMAMCTSGATGTMTSANRTDIATQVQSILRSVVAQANTSFQGVYVFAGTASTTPPFVQASSSFISSAASLATTTPLTAGSTTTISDAQTGQSFSFNAAAGDTVATLSQAVANAVSAGTLSASASASVDGSGHLALASAGGIVASSNDTVLGTLSATPGTTVANAYAYVGNNHLNSVAIADSQTVNSNLSGSQLFTAGSNVLQSLGKLITTLQSGTPTQIGDATTAITTALNFVSQQRIPLNDNINQINSQESYLSQERLTLTTQQKSLVGIDLAEAVTNLSQAQLTNSAVLAMAAKVVPQTLLDYLK
jgi:flagellar hook-associated protein 3